MRAALIALSIEVMGARSICRCGGARGVRVRIGRLGVVTLGASCCFCGRLIGACCTASLIALMLVTAEAFLSVSSGLCVSIPVTVEPCSSVGSEACILTTG